MLALGVPQRAVPMAALLGVRVAALAARAALGSGSPAALRHYARHGGASMQIIPSAVTRTL